MFDDRLSKHTFQLTNLIVHSLRRQIRPFSEPETAADFVYILDSRRTLALLHLYNVSSNPTAPRF